LYKGLDSGISLPNPQTLWCRLFFSEGMPMVPRRNGLGMELASGDHGIPVSIGMVACRRWH
ncbi:MAG: hypothetical protein ACK58T_08480, partial [Phycisphaerae bacterium]